MADKKVNVKPDLKSKQKLVEEKYISSDQRQEIMNNIRLVQNGPSRNI